jgi:hypothetical protein
MMFLLSCVIFQIDGPCWKKVRIQDFLFHIEIVLRQIQVKSHNPGFLILYWDFIWANTCQICELDGLC